MKFPNSFLVTRSWLPLLVILFALFAAHAQTTSVTGNVRDIATVPLTTVTSTQVTFELKNFGGRIPKSGGLAIEHIKVAFKPDTSGNFSGSVYSNAGIDPSGTDYNVCIENNGQALRCERYLVSGATWTLESATPLVVVPNLGTNQVILQSFLCPQPIATTTWTCAHNFNDSPVFTQLSDSSGRQIFPDTANISNLNIAVFTFLTPQAGNALITHAGSVAIATTQPNAVLQNSVAGQVIQGASPLTISSPTEHTGSFGISGIGTPRLRPYSANQAGLTSLYMDWARPACTGGSTIGYMAAFSLHAEDTPTYDNTPGVSTPCFDVAILSTAARSGTRTDSIWNANYIANYSNAGSVVGQEIDLGNFYQNYVVGGADTNFYTGLLMVSQGTFSPDSAVRVLTSGTGKWRRGLVLENISDRAIEFGALTTYAMYGQGNQTIFNNGGAWAWQNSSSSLALHRFTPAADDTNIELFGTNAAKNVVTWNVDNSGNFLATSFRTRSANPSLTGIFRCASSDACLSFRNNANKNDIPLAKNSSDQLTFGGVVMAQTIASGTATMTTALIGAGSCGATITVSAANVVTTDAIVFSFNAAIGANPGALTVHSWPTANNVNFEYCNGTAAGVTPTAATLNWRVVR